MHFHAIQKPCFESFFCLWTATFACGLLTLPCGAWILCMTYGPCPVDLHLGFGFPFCLCKLALVIIGTLVSQGSLKWSFTSPCRAIFCEISRPIKDSIEACICLGKQGHDNIICRMLSHTNTHKQICILINLCSFSSHVVSHSICMNIIYMLFTRRHW